MPRSLSACDVLLLDCQSTGASPERGHLLEVAWCRTTARDLSAGRVPEVASHLVALPTGERLPPRISKLTGIREKDLQDALPRAEVWGRLHAALTGAPEPIAIVAHFARFERAFLDALQREHADGELGIEWICTHEIVCRLLPGLPRRGLRAVSGYLGHVMDEGKRAASHVRATGDVWSDLVRRLERDHGVATLPALHAWIDGTERVARTGRDYSVAREMRLQLTEAPGIYRMLGRHGQLLYVGKATSLRRRVNSYFQKRRKVPGRTLELLTQVFDVDVTVTATALEAALSESDAIKRHAPPYNVALRGRHEHLYFVGADLSDVRSRPSAGDRGPVPRRETLDAWSALAALLTGADDESLFRRAMGLPDGGSLEGVCLQDGLELFRSGHDLPPADAPPLGRLLGLGVRLWRIHRDAAEDEQPEDHPEDHPKDHAEEPEAGAEAEKDDAPRSSWAPQVPEEAAARLAGTVLHGAHLLRRGRWLRSLADSALVWQTSRAEPDAPWRLLVLERGDVARADEVPPETSAPAPRTSGRSDILDVATYDRLRVLTTELRRLVAAGRSIELCLGPRQRLDRESLARRLYWV